MKVAMLGWEFPPFISGGLGIHCLGLTQALAARGVEIDFYMPHMASVEGPLRVADHYKHVNIIEVEADPGGGPYGAGRKGYEANFNKAVELYNRRVVRAFRSHDADVVHAHDWITVPAALELRRRTGKPLLWTVHSIEHDRSAGFFPQRWIEEVEGRGANGADHVITVSSYTRGMVLKHYGADPARVTPIHNGVDLSRFTQRIRRNYERPRNRVLFLSRVSRQKGPMHFMRAAKRVLEKRPHAQFLMVGKGEMLPECIQFALENRMTDRVRFAGHVPDADLPSLYHECDVYVLPSVSEPFGISICEAMAGGVPSLVSKTTGVGEALAHVLKVDYWDEDEMANCIIRLLDYPALREELGRNGAREVRKFTWERTAERTHALYERLASHRRAPLEVLA